MVYYILSEDFIAVSLYFTNGNINAKIEEVIMFAEKYQKENNRMFGITESEFRNSFAMLFLLSEATLDRKRIYK